MCQAPMRNDWSAPSPRLLCKDAGLGSQKHWKQPDLALVLWVFSILHPGESRKGSQNCIYGIQLNVSKERFRCDSDASPKILTSWWQKKERITMMELQLPGPTSEAEWIRIGKDSNQTGISKKTWFVDKKCDSSLSIHAWYEEDVLRRGSCPWPRPSSFPGFAVTFEEEDLLFLGFFGQAPLGLLWSHRVPSCSSASSCWSHSCQRCRYAGGKLRCKPGFSESFRDHDSKVANLKSERYTQLTPTG